jgi:hypothetical protein
MDWRHVGELLAAEQAIFSELKNICVWNKSTPGMASGQCLCRRLPRSFRSQLASGLKGNGPAQRASLRMIEAIEGDFEAKKTEFLKVVIDNKADAEQEIERRRKLGITDISDINPHPDDLLVDMATGEVHVKDELNPKDSRMLKGLGLKR